MVDFPNLLLNMYGADKVENMFSKKSSPSSKYTSNLKGIHLMTCKKLYVNEKDKKKTIDE